MNLETIRFASTAVHQTVLVAPSLNLETDTVVSDEILERIISESEGHVVADRKTQVERLVIFDAPDGGKLAGVTYHSGHSQNIPLGEILVDRIAAGSSANIANTLKQMGTGAVGVIGAVGGGSDGETIIQSLLARGFAELLLLKRQSKGGGGGTADSLFVKGTPSGQMAIFSKKPTYTVDPEMLAYLGSQATARVIACTGFVPYEFPLVEALFTTASEPEARVLSPHRACFQHSGDRKRCLDLAGRAHLFHVNRLEAQELLELQDDDWVKGPDNALTATLTRIPAAIVCITLDGEGSLTYRKEDDALIRQTASPVSQVNSKIGAGDVHLASLMWFLWLRERRISLEAALEVAAWIAARKLEFAGRGARPWDGIPASQARKPIVHAAEAQHPRTAKMSGTFPQVNP